MHRRPHGVAAQRLFLHGRRLPLLVFLHGHGLIKRLLRGLGRGRFAGGEQVFDGVVHGVENGALILEFYHGLGGVDIHVHGVFGEGDMQHAAGELALEQAVAVGLLQRGGKELALYEPAVHEEKLAAAGAAAV